VHSSQNDNKRDNANADRPEGCNDLKNFIHFLINI
jgi:hypothetical protein